MSGKGLNPRGEEEKGRHCHSAGDSDGWEGEEQGLTALISQREQERWAQRGCAA